MIASHLSLLLVRLSEPNSFSFLQYVFQPSHHLRIPLLDPVQIFSVSLELAQSSSLSQSLYVVTLPLGVSTCLPSFVSSAGLVRMHLVIHHPDHFKRY